MIVDFLCETLSELANMSSRDLDAGVLNLHKALSNVAKVAHRVRLNVTKFMLLYTICLHFLDRINYLALVNQANIDVYTHDDVAKMRTHYQELQQSITLTAGLGSVAIPKLTPVKLQDFKTAVMEYLSRAVEKKASPWHTLFVHIRSTTLSWHTILVVTD